VQGNRLKSSLETPLSRFEPVQCIGEAGTRPLEVVPVRSPLLGDADREPNAVDRHARPWYAISNSMGEI
jgi:hypothetical protein